ncbi:DUF3576 domain-containing protein [Candidatus Pelagibacter sp.]|uniref:DUF3576 domain-containing protein n=1 Tax=Candidatus Pelagibacter sp. TaxID=2024849 RepID=UPI003F8661C9
MSFIKLFKILSFFIVISLFLNGCNGKIPGADARKFPADPKERVKQNLEQGRGFTLNKAFGNGTRGGTFDFASSNELWRASLDVIDFMPLTSVNYSGGIIITDWYSDGNNSNESIKISIRFLTNEIRSDALDVKIFTKKCLDNFMNCKILQTDKVLINELKKEILKKAAIYAQQKKDENFKPYTNKGLGIE